MPIRDTAAMNRSLDNDYGTTAGPNSPASWQLALFDGDPMVPAVDGGGVELDATDCPGYARVTVAQSAFLAASDGLKSTSAPVQFPTATADWTTTATHWALFDAASPTQMWDCSILGERIDVVAGPGPSVIPTIFYDDAIQSA